MPRRRLTISSTHPYHITARSNNKEWFYLPIPIVWEILCEKLFCNSELYSTRIHAVVLMSNHLHMILTSPNENLGEVMRHLLTEVSKGIQRRANRINHVFGSRYKWSLLESAYAVAYVYKYVLRNPVRAGLIERVEDYPYSTFFQSAPQSFPPVVEGIERHWTLVPRSWEERSRWLNLPTKKENEALIQKGLRRASFRFSSGNDVKPALGELESSYGLGPKSTQLDDRYLYGREGD